MKKTIVIFTVLIIGCGTKPTDTVTSDNTKDSIIQGSGKAMITTLDNELEDFNEFFKKFTTDSLFQIERIKFPWRLLITTEDGETVEETSRDNWTHLTFYYEDSYASRQIDAYTQEIKNYGDTVNLEIRGVDNGIYTDYEFVKENTRWFLVSGKDFSN